MSPDRGAERHGSLTRRNFLIGSGATFAAASTFGPLLSRATATASAPTIRTDFALGLSDGFQALASSSAQLAMSSFDAVAGSGASLIRFPVYWDMVQPHPAALDWSQYRALHEQIVFHGFKALPVVVGCPSWIGDANLKTTAGGLSYPTGSGALDRFNEFVVQTLAYFSWMGPHIDAVEVWSEPNNPGGAHIPDPRDFSRMLSSAALAVERANAGGYFRRPLTLVSGGLDTTQSPPSWQRYLDGFCSQSSPYVLGLHLRPAALPTAPVSEYAAQAESQLRAVIEVARAQTGRDIWITGATPDPLRNLNSAEATAVLSAITNAVSTHDACKALLVSSAPTGAVSKTRAGSLSWDGVAATARGPMLSTTAAALKPIWSR